MVQRPNYSLETRIGFLIEHQTDDILELLAVIRQVQAEPPNLFGKNLFVIASFITVGHDWVRIDKIILLER